MQGRLFRRTQSVGLALGAALLVADCAGPTALRPAARPESSSGVTSIDGANVALASFENSAFPYHGLIPNYQETGKTRPFLDVDDNGRLGHSSPRGGIHWEDQTYSDRSVLLAAPQSFDPARAGRDHRLLPRQHGDAVARRHRPAADRAPAYRFGPQCGSGRAATRGRRARFERRAVLVAGRIRRLSRRGAVEARRTLSRTRAAPSGACRWSSSPIAAAICRRSIRSPSAAIRAASAAWCCSTRSMASATSSCAWSRDRGATPSSSAPTRPLRARATKPSAPQLEADGVQTVSGLPAQLTPGVVAFVDAGSVDHNDFVTSALGGAPLRDIISRIGG